MKKALSRLHLLGSGANANAREKLAAAKDIAQLSVFQTAGKSHPELCHPDQIQGHHQETSASMSTGATTVHSSEDVQSTLICQHNSRASLGGKAPNNASSSLQSEDDRYSFNSRNSVHVSRCCHEDDRCSQDDGNVNDPQIESDPQSEPLMGHPNYHKLQDLNRGASGFVQLALNLSTSERVAIKFLERSNCVSQRVMSRELLNHRECALHPNIVQLKEVFLTQHHLAIALEYADGGDLSEYIDNRAQNGEMGCSEDDARWMFQQFMVGLDYCHRMGIANRDIKLDNVLLHGKGPRPVVKICDFGYSKDEVAGSICKTACGTPEYMAPEVLTSEVYDGKVADMWSCGVMLYVLLVGTFPFVRCSDQDLKNAKALQIMFGRIIQAEYEEPAEVSRECRDLLRGLLIADPKHRLTVQQVEAHPWFLHDLPTGALEVNSRLKVMDNVQYGQCKQSAQQIMDIVEECHNYCVCNFEA